MARHIRLRSIWSITYRSLQLLLILHCITCRGETLDEEQVHFTLDSEPITGNDEHHDFAPASFTKTELEFYRQKVKGFFNFALDKYLERGYPYDEIRPLSCVPKTRNFDNSNDLVTNDVLGNFTTTLIDSLTTVAIIGDRERMKELVDLVVSTYDNFAIDSVVQVFETTIRVVGGLMSTHLYITDPRKKVYLGDEYDGESLLRLARDMADRLLPAYMTKTGLPVPRVNLLTKFYGLTTELVNENNAAGMASPMFEFTMLSYLTGDQKYERIARYAFDKVWSMRSARNLLPMSFNPQDRHFYSTMTGTGASVDSFFEYALKGAVLFDDEALYDIWTQSYDALNIDTRGDWFYYNVDSNSGGIFTRWIDSLSGFFPGVQTLHGDLDDAVPKHLMFLKLWDTFGGIPERWGFNINRLLPGNSGAMAHASRKMQAQSSRDADLLRNVDLHNLTAIREANEMLKQVNTPLEWYPLRPEFIESTYFLYRATRDPLYLQIGARIARDLETRFMGPCGFAGFQDIYNGKPQDRMESFVLSETLKYLYLLFDEGNELHSTRDNTVFSTEGHPMWLLPEVKRRYKTEGTFTDPWWIQHLAECEREEIAYLERRQNHGGDAAGGNMFFKFAKRLLRGTLPSTEDEPGAGAGTDNSTLAAEAPDAALAAETTRRAPATCPVYTPPSLEGPAHAQWLYSPLLSGYSRLFEIEERFGDTLVPPLWNRDLGPELRREGLQVGLAPGPGRTAASAAIELDPAFYARWADPRGSRCRRAATSESVDLYFVSNGDADTDGAGEARLEPPVVHRNNRTVASTSFLGRHKLRVEKVSPGQVDTHGDTVQSAQFEGADRVDTLSSKCDATAALYTPTTLYVAGRLDGIAIPKGYAVELPFRDLFPEDRDVAGSSLGLNAQRQLLLDCTPIVNIRVVQ